jgi:hypothetical protein
MTELEIHPAADAFPMMSDDELAELADDIKENGLVHPLVLSADGKMLIDGRNRLKACEIAGVTPRFEKLNGQDPLAFIASANLQRRNLSKGQQAMLMAILYPEPEKLKRKGSGSLVSKEQLSQARLSQARTVLHSTPDLVPFVLSGTKPLDAAYEEAVALKRAVQSDDKKKEKLRIEAPEIAELVDEERLTLVAALAELDERKRQERVQREIGHAAAQRLGQFCIDVTSIAGAIRLGEKLLNADIVNEASKATGFLIALLQEQEA